MQAFYFAPWVPGASYHVYNRAVPLNRLFCTAYNITKFRTVLREKLRPFFVLYSVACVGNHFHLHGRVRSLEAIEAHLRSLSKPLSRQRRYLLGELNFQELVGDAFGRTFQAYARSFNIEQGRTGNLLDQTVRRIRVREDLLSRSLCAYHHFNEFKHGLRKDQHGLGPKTTYEEIVRGESDLVDLDAVYARFGGMDGFVRFHEEYGRRKKRSMLDFDEEKYFGYEKYPERFTWELNRGEAYRDDGVGGDGVGGDE